MSEAAVAPRAALDLTYVLYDESSLVSHVLALLTLSPILLNPAYAVLAVQTRELLFIEMWAGQMFCEGLNWALKHIIREERPNHNLGPGFGFPSSHSQWMGYFAAFVLCHFTFRHRFVPMGSRLLDIARKSILHVGVVAWAALVAYSRYYLSYHTPHQVIWGSLIGALFGVIYYALVEYIPTRKPSSIMGKARIALLSNPVCTWLRIRDGWSVWSDGGMEVQWHRWREEWDGHRSEDNHARSGIKQE
ncbi:PAP2-domain-containing protein [Laetiporus sulphureus 93-53]|uniref:PAP2-domain-containing protein n=1 Tax=Laetiporus sulphureus 93-53 TaxID=1314785 RepID=A0A165ELF5_9APHY|nr:PAP2-domain-containing protein [Laetiporus sulphureus 93-53]KZT07304.1 PAP2-domain-containing protein [Laetiporus sulphureus 93-53]